MDGIAVTASPATPRARAPVPSLPCGGGTVDGKGAGGTRAGAGRRDARDVPPGDGR